jgi:ribosomal-protein-alanine N-acetyltransferase
MTIRPYIPSDYPQIIELFRLNTPEYFSPDEEEGLADYLNSHIQYHYIAEIDGKIMGCGGYAISKDRSTAHIAWDIVHPDSHGKGVGRKLTAFRIEEIRKIESVNIIVVRTSQLAYKFYEKFGFKLKEVTKNYWAEGFDLYHMEYDMRQIIIP